MKARTTTFVMTIAAVTSTLLASISHAHPGHESEDVFHAISHELTSLRAIVFLLIAGAVVVAWRWYTRDKSD
jgi:hypothetical protein